VAAAISNLVDFLIARRCSSVHRLLQDTSRMEPAALAAARGSAGAAGFSLGLFLAALNVKYRTQYASRFSSSLLFGTPIIYPPV